LLLKLYLGHSEKSESEQLSPSESMNSLDFMNAQRAYPDMVIPKAGFFSGYEDSKMRLNKGERHLNPLDTWQSIGPDNQGGRTLSIAVDPQNPDVIYAGSASGGLWRMTFSSQNNYSWEYIDTGFPVLGVNSIAIDPRDTDVLYIGTGEVYGYQNSDGGLFDRITRGSYGIGLLKSTDRGVTWTKSIDWTLDQRRGILALELNPLNPDIVFAGTTEGTFKSVDAGQTWELIHSELMAVDVAINPADTNIVYISCGNLSTPGVGIYRSMDSGATWTKLTNGLPSGWSGKTMLDIYKSSPNILYADIANTFETIGLYRSEDNGDTWQQVMGTIVDYATFQGWYAHYVRVDPVDADRLLIGGVNFFVSGKKSCFGYYHIRIGTLCIHKIERIHRFAW